MIYFQSTQQAFKDRPKADYATISCLFEGQRHLTNDQISFSGI